MYILDFLNKIKWDKRENPDSYSFFYMDRIENNYKEINFKDIIRIEGNFIIIIKDNEEVNIPLHRIKFIKKKGIVIWKR